MNSRSVAAQAADEMAVARIGPNAVFRIREALDGQTAQNSGPAPSNGSERSVTRTVFERAGLVHHLKADPTTMVPEADVTQLQAALRNTLGPVDAARINREAGALTGRYLLAHRIPKVAQVVMRLAPAPLAARLLLGAIGQHAWTFAGSGQFYWAAQRRGIGFAIAHCPYCRDITISNDPCGCTAGAGHASGACDYVAATFETLFRALVHPNTMVREISCAASGAPACRFTACWARAPRRTGQ